MGKAYGCIPTVVWGTPYTRTMLDTILTWVTLVVLWAAWGSTMKKEDDKNTTKHAHDDEKVLAAIFTRRKESHMLAAWQVGHTIPYRARAIRLRHARRYASTRLQAKQHTIRAIRAYMSAHVMHMRATMRRSKRGHSSRDTTRQGRRAGGAKGGAMRMPDTDFWRDIREKLGAVRTMWGDGSCWLWAVMTALGQVEHQHPQPPTHNDLRNERAWRHRVGAQMRTNGVSEAPIRKATLLNYKTYS